METRRLSVVVVCVCALVCVFVAGAASAAAPTEFGETGTGLGQFQYVSGVGVDQASGDVYVGDKSNFQITKFTGAGDPLLAWGWNVNGESPAEELQTCEAVCQRGTPGAAAGQFGGGDPHGVAVDPATGDVYVAEFENERVQKFGPRGEFILMFGWEVNKTTKANVCTEQEIKSSGVECTAGVEGPEEGAGKPGQFSMDYQGSYIAVGPGGNVYVGDKARVQIFDETGVFKEEIPLEEPEFPSWAAVKALAVDSLGDVFVNYEYAEGVREFTFNKTSSKWEEDSVHFDNNPNPYAIAAIAVDAAGDLYVGDSEPPGQFGFQILEYRSTGEQIASFGAKTVAEYSVAGIAFSNTADTAGELYVTGDNLKSEPRVFAFTPPPPGPLIEPGSESGPPERHGEARFEATINPEGHETTYEVEYISEAQFQADGEAYGAGTANMAGSVPIKGKSEELFEDYSVEVKLPEATLVPGTTYHWRFVATDSLSQKTTGPDKTLEEMPPALIDGPWAENMAATSATLAARIDPQGASTSYRLEYGTSTAYEHVLSGNVGEGNEFVPIGHHVQELAPGTTYHFRIVTTNECIVGQACTQEGADHTFTTQLGGEIVSGLPDGRAWELVSPPNTGGSVLRLTQFGQAAADDGGAITYKALGTPLGENAVSNNDYLLGSQTLSRRGPDGWQTRAIDPPQEPLTEGAAPGLLVARAPAFALFSRDLSTDTLYPAISSSYSPEAMAGTPYLRDNANGSYAPLLTRADVWAGTASLETAPPPAYIKTSQVKVLAATPDLAHVLLGSPLKLTEEAFVLGEDTFVTTGNLYEWSAGRLQLVNRLPETNEATDETGGAALAGLNGKAQGSTQRSVSDDGRWVAWTRGNPYSPSTKASYKGLYLRDMVAGRTVQIGGPFSAYQTMSSDGSRIFFTERGDLYEYDTATGARIDLTAGHGAGEADAGVQDAVSDVSEDGSYAYFVANGVLAAGASPGDCGSTTAPPEEQTCSLYISREAGGKWSTSYIATLSGTDEKSWTSTSATEHESEHLEELQYVTSRVSPDGRYLAFMSQRSLTGYDNVDANPEAYEMKEEQGKLEVVRDKEGKPVRAHDVEVYLYDALTARLVCASCDPSGARPVGVFTSKKNVSGELEHLAVETGAWSEVGKEHWLAGSVPGWQVNQLADTVYQPRYLLDSGRLFFNSPVALAPQDTNGLEDVYQYEPAGAGDCTSASATFAARSGGCVSAISSGTSSEESAFMDASESGNDAFFLSNYHLTAADEDKGYDVWDAHVCSASSPCPTAPVSPPPCSSGDSCKPAPAPQPELFGSAPSATFSGAGNLAPAPPVASKPLTRAQKLSKALSSCRKKYKKSKRRRAACERRAHKRYGHAAQRSRKANAITRGGK